MGPEPTFDMSTPLGGESVPKLGSEKVRFSVHAETFTFLLMRFFLMWAYERVCVVT
jgi:hypothetical protein